MKLKAPIWIWIIVQLDSFSPDNTCHSCQSMLGVGQQWTAAALLDSRVRRQVHFHIVQPGVSSPEGHFTHPPPSYPVGARPAAFSPAGWRPDTCGCQSQRHKQKAGGGCLLRNSSPTFLLWGIKLASTEMLLMCHYIWFLLVHMEHTQMRLSP